MRVASAVVLAATLSTPVMAASDWAKVDQALGHRKLRGQPAPCQWSLFRPAIVM